MKTFQELKEYLGGFRLGSFPTMKPMASLGDKAPNQPAGQQSLGVGINAAYSSQAAGTMRPFLKAQKKKTVKKEKWSKKYKDSIDCSNPKGFSQKAHCQGKKEETELENYLNNKLKKMADKTYTITISETDEKILLDQVHTVQSWIDGAVTGKINSSWNDMRNTWTDQLMNDESFTDPIPSVKADFVTLVTGRSDYEDYDTKSKKLEE